MATPPFLGRRFCLTYEVNPPRSPDASTSLEQARVVASYVDAINVTDCPLSNLRMSPGPVAARIEAELRVPTIPHVTSRDRNLLGIQSELLGLHYAGIRNVFALTGDPVSLGDHPDTKGVFELYANQLVALVQRLNRGQDAMGHPVEPPTSFHVGTAVTLTDRRPESLDIFQKKLDAGAEFFQTQIVFDPETLEKAPKGYDTDRPVLIGTTPLRSAKMLATFRSIPGVEIPERTERRLKDAPDFAAEANRVVVELADYVKGRYQGLHLMPITPDERQLVALLKELRGTSTRRVVESRVEDIQ